MSKAFWFWLVISVIIYGFVLFLYFRAVKTQAFPGPLFDPMRSFGILAFALVLVTAGYTLRRRFARNLPGKVQGWLWMHTWLGVTTILVVLLHENFRRILNDYCTNASCLTYAYGGTSALIALTVLVLSGLVGRALDQWQARRIAQDASSNGVGIVRAIEERQLELEYTIERLCAGKSEAFQHYCLQALENPTANLAIPNLAPGEQNDFQRARQTLVTYAGLTGSLKQQKQARAIFRTWRILHIILACVALLIITIHSVMELLTNVLRIVKPF